MSAFVYVLEEEPIPGEKSGPWVKIGYTKNRPEWRLDANLKRGNPRNIRIAAAYKYETESAAREAERNAHNHFQYCAHQKEWFRIEPAAVKEWFTSNGALEREGEGSSHVS